MTNYQDLLQTHDAEQLELAYQAALQADEAHDFSEAVEEAYRQQPDDVLVAAWHYRLRHAVSVAKGKVIAWIWALPLALLNGLLFWWLSDEQFILKLPGQTYGGMPALLLYWAAIAAVFVAIYLAMAGNRRKGLVAGWLAGLALLVMYVVWRYPRLAGLLPADQYLSLGAMHVPVLAVMAVAAPLLIGRRTAEDVFAFLSKLLEAVIMAGILALVVVLFSGLTTALFRAINIQLSDTVMRLLFAGGAGLIPVLAAAIVYDAAQPPARQSFDDGLGKVVPMLMRIILPLSAVVLLVYVAFIPFNFRAAFVKRNILVTYNATLFAMIVLLLGASPVSSERLSAAQQRWLRRGIVGVAVLAGLVSLYALIAIGYRTWRGVLTPNRFAFMGWGLINMALLAGIIIKQARASLDNWIPALKQVFAAGAGVYALWALIVVLLTPWLFMHQSAEYASLPESVQRAIYGGGDPILLKCYGSDHIYLLEHGKKRWIKDIPTFEEQGFVWEDVYYVQCDALRQIPDGKPIPPDAGPPPVPQHRFGPAPTPTLAPTPTPLPTPSP